MDACNGAPEEGLRDAIGEGDVKNDYNDFDRTLLRAGRTARAPSRLRKAALAAATGGGATALAATAAKTTAAVNGAKASAAAANATAAFLRVMTIKWAIVAAVGTASVG